MVPRFLESLCTSDLAQVIKLPKQNIIISVYF